ncbi:MAG: choice-of-anchor B family protein [Saprospiraceae bacterium]|nr:choice-of-anchor B family protein [Saprospiraceae bacterium]
MIQRFTIILCFLFVGNVIFAQGFNVDLKSHVGGMPGNEYNDIWGFVDSDGNEFAVIGSSLAINIFNVTDCSNPVLVQSFTDGANAIWRDFKTYRNYLYAVCDQTGGRPCAEGLEIINLDNYSFTQQTNVFTRAHNIYIDTTHARLYVVGSNAGGMLIYALNDPGIGATPGNPVLLRNFGTPYIHDIYVRNNIAYASVGYSGYNIYDVSNPNNIPLLASLNNSNGYNHSSWLNESGTHAFIAEELPRGRPIRVYQISGSGASTSISYVHNFKEPLEAPFDLGCRPHNPFVKGDSLFISYYEDGLQVFDISNPLSPVRIAYFDSYTAQNGQGYNIPVHDWKGQWGSYPFLPSGCILMSDITQGLYTLKLNIPPNIGTNVDNKAKADYSGILFDNPDKGVVLTSPSGHCYRLKVNPNGTVFTERIICYVPGQTEVRLLNTDLVVTDPRRKVVLKDQNHVCREVKVNTSGNLINTALPECPGIALNYIKVEDTDMYLETFTKGIITRGMNDQCYKITVLDSGNLQVVPLTECP